MPISYNPANNRIYVTGYTSGTPCTFDDIYNADKAGTFELLDGTIDADPDTFSLDNAVRPTDELALQLTITCTARGGATCDITGEDAWGNALTEAGIDISSGSATTTEYFGSVDASGITVDGMTNGDDFDIAQGQWGRVSKMSDISYYFESSRLYIGDGTDESTYFADTNKLVTFAAGNDRCIELHYYDSNFRLGEVIDETLKVTGSGCALFVENTRTNIFIVSQPDTLGVVELYSSSFQASGNYDGFLHLKSSGGGRVWNCYFGNRAQLSFAANLDVFNLTACETVGLRRPNENTSIERMTVLRNSEHAVYFQDPTVQTANAVYGRAVDWDHSSTKDVPIGMNDTGANYCYVNDCDFNEWAIQWLNNTTGSRLVRQHNFDLRVVDYDGTGIQDATVTMNDVDGTEIFSEATDASGDIAKQLIPYGYYEQATGDTIQPVGSYSPHVVTISKPGYAPKTITYTMDRVHVEVEALGSATPHGAEYRRRRVSGYVSEMVEL